jgi:hypothetical protein
VALLTLYMDKIKNKTLDVPFFPELDGLAMEEVGDFLEQKAEKHSIDSLNWAKQFPYQPVTIFTIAHSEKYIYVDYFVRCNFLRAMNYTDNSPVADDSCVEFFLQLPDSDEYWNFEFNCIGACNASHRVDRLNPTRLSSAEMAQIKRYASCGSRPFQEMEGIFAWNVTIAVPFSLIGVAGDSLPKYIMANFYKCASRTSLPHYLSWSPIRSDKPNFHCPEFFGKICLK